MKFQVILMLALASCLNVCLCEAQQAPYLPSGWRPKGPAFELPTEVKGTRGPRIDATQDFSSEGSSFLREYGPPDSVNGFLVNPIQDLTPIVPENVFQDLTVQALPDEEPNLSFKTTNNIFDERKEENDNLDQEKTIIKENTSGASNENSQYFVADRREGKTVDQETEPEKLPGIVTDADHETSEFFDDRKKSYDVVLVNKEDLSSTLTEKSEKENEKSAEIKVIEPKPASAASPAGFLEYGPPRQSQLPSNAEGFTFEAPAYLPPQLHKRDVRRAQGSWT